MISVYNGIKWVSHMVCDRTEMNHVYTQHIKSQGLIMLQHFERFVFRCYKCTIEIIEIDSEMSLIKEFESWTACKGIIIERSPSYIKEQKSKAEQSDGILILEACVILI